LNGPVDDLVHRVVNENQGQWADRLGGSPKSGSHPVEGSRPRSALTSRNQGAVVFLAYDRAMRLRRTLRGWIEPRRKS